MTTRDHLINHYELHPKMEIRDMFKYIFQSSFGCEHLVSDEARALAYIKAELCEVTEARAWRVDELDGDRKSTRLNSSHSSRSRMPSSA